MKKAGIMTEEAPEAPSIPAGPPIVRARPVRREFEGPQYIVDKGKVFQGLRINGFHGYVPCPTVPESTAYMSWEGGRVAKTVWDQVMAFFEWSQEEFKSEAQVRLYYNTETGRWAAWAYPQEPSGMTTKELPDHADYATQREQFPRPWTLLGTIHHHCTMSAFQSGTDRENEQAQEGVHITVGKVSTSEYDLHGRVIVRNTQYDVLWHQWFELPAEVDRVLMPQLRASVLQAYLKIPPPKDTPFPDQWKLNCHKPRYSTYGGKHSASDKTERTYVIKTDLKSQFQPDEVHFMRACADLMKVLQLTHSSLDGIVATDDTQRDEPQKAAANQVFAIANKYNVGAARVDALFDQWDFAIVLAELDRDAASGVQGQS